MADRPDPLVPVICEGCRWEFKLYRSVFKRSAGPFFCGTCKWFDIRSWEQGKRFYVTGG